MTSSALSTPCWVWPAGTNGSGYGALRLSPNGPKLLAHRVIYELVEGPIPDGLELDHVCRNPICVNPDHLDAVTHAENIRRGYEARGLKTNCKHGHDLSVYGRPKPDGSGRDCRECDRMRSAARNAARKEYKRQYYLTRKASRVAS